MEDKNLLLQCLDIAEIIFKFAKEAWDALNGDLYTLLNIEPTAIPEWAQPLSDVLSWSFIEFVIGGFGFYVVYSIVKWVVGIITG